MSVASTIVAKDCDEVSHEETLRWSDRSPRKSLSVLRYNLRASSRDGGAYGVMVGMGESYFAAFALAAGMGEVAAGLVVSVPMLIGGLVQLLSRHAVRWCGNEKRWIVIGSTLQAMIFLPLIVATWFGSIPVWLFFAIISGYWASGLGAGPAWNGWISTLVPPVIRPRYFSRRTRLIQVSTFTSFLIGGSILALADRAHAPMFGFAILFSFAFLFRLLSVGFLASHREVKIKSHSLHRDSANLAPHFGYRLVIYLISMQFFVQLSGPYFVPFMLKKLDFTYTQYVILMGATLIGKSVAMPLWGELVKKSNSRTLLLCGGLAIIPLSFMWTLSHHFAWLLLTQCITGIAWSAYELGFFMVFMNDVPLTERSRLLTRYNFFNSIAWFSGAMIGGGILTLGIASIASYHTLFILSGIGRLACVIMLWQIYRTPTQAVRIPTSNPIDPPSHATRTTPQVASN